MMKSNIKELKQRALAGDLSALQELRELGFMSGNRSKYTMAPVSYAQRRLWFIDKMDSTAAYNLSAAIQLEGKLNQGALEYAFIELFRRHEILRTCFVETDGIPYQKIFSETDNKLETTDLRFHPDSGEQIKTLLAEESQRCFDLSKGPLMICHLYRTEEEKHVLILNIHHIICDGWSVGVLISELTQLYHAHCLGMDNPLHTLKLQYKDYAAGHERMLHDGEAVTHKNFWTEKLSGELPVSELFPYVKRPLNKTFNGRVHEIEIDQSLLPLIEKLYRQEQVSLFMFLVSVANILVYKYSGHTDVILGSPVSGREQRGLEDQIGFYVNTLPLRNEVSRGMTFRDFLREVKKNCIEAFDHQIYPFDLIIEDLKLVRDTSRNPLFEIVLSLQEAGLDAINFDEIQSTYIEPEVTFSKFDLHFNFEVSSGGLWFKLIYNPDVLSDEQIQRVGLHFTELLRNIVNSPEQQLDRLEIITQKEKDQILLDFNNSTCDYPSDHTIAGLFEEIVEKYGSKAAVVYQGNPLLYWQLNEQANLLADHLIRSCDLKLDEPVVIFMTRSHELIVAILAVLKAGGAYLPLDTNMPEERILTILDDVKVRMVISDSSQDKIRFQVPCVIRFSKELLSGLEGSRQNPQVGKNSSNLAYILYTSGSSGIPKGSMIEEKSVIRLVRNSNITSFDAGSNVFSASSISFDATTMDLWGALLNGGTLFLENSEDYIDPVKLGYYFSKYNINRIIFPTGFFVRLAEADQQYKLGLFSGFDEFAVGGDKLPSGTTNQIVASYPEVTIINGYGPTENTTLTTSFRVNRQFDSDIPIGKPVSNSTVFILNDEGNLCPVGVAGEIYIGGAGLSRGYVNRPELNQKSFVVHPFSKGERLYRSGDFGYWNEEGNILFLGRKDDQVKIRGYRIETGEIENVAARFPGVTNALIRVIQEQDQKELALYFTGSESIGKEDLKRFLSGKLPEYMLPKYYMRLEAFPLNQNGKADLRALPLPEIGLATSSSLYEAESQTSKILVKIFEEILNVRNLTVTDNFFNVGGHSLKAIRAVSAIHKELSVKVTLQEFFAGPDVKSLEELIREKKREILGTIPIVEDTGFYELSYAQKRLWVLDKIEKSGPTYNIPLAVTIYDVVDAGILQAALDRMIQKHESLRTIFTEVDGDPCQQVISDARVAVNCMDFTNETDAEKKVSDYITEEAKRVFDLAQIPLLRLYLIKSAAEKYVLFLNIHHIICDGWSVNILMDELFGGYRQIAGQSKLPPAKLTLQYKDYSSWLNGRINGTESASDRAYWHEKFREEITPLDLPADFHRPVVKTYQGDSLYFSFSKELKSSLDTFNVEKRSSLFMTLVAAIKVLLFRYSGKTDIIVGTPVAGRDHPDLENQIGYYANTLALRDQLNPKKTFIEWLEEVKKTATEAYSHQMYPFDKLVEEIKLPRDTSRSPMFDVMIVLQNTDGPVAQLFRKMESYKIPLEISKFDLTFNFNDSPGNLEFLMEYNTNLFKKERIVQIASHLQLLLTEVITNPAKSIKSIHLLSGEEQSLLLQKYTDTEAGYPAEKTIVSLFEESVRRHPNHIAVEYKDQSLSYLQLNSKVNTLARALRQNHTILPGEPIGVLISPSENTVVLLLSILKAGGAYVPIDPEYPDERIHHILSESRISLLITQREDELRLNRMNEEKGKHLSFIVMDELLSDMAWEDSNLTGIETNPDTTAYVIFTSGSTGKPKGCQISHRNLVRLFVNDRSNFDFSSSDVWVMAHSYCFDFSVWEMYGALLFGGKLIIPERSEVRDISAFVKLVRKQGITVLNQTPGAFYNFIDTALGERERESLKIRYVIFGGDKLNPSKLKPWVKQYPAGKVRLINMYGITETTIHVTYHRFSDKEILASDGSSIIGKPLPETQVYILDEDRQLVPVGVPGEIYVGGTGLSKGYVNRPDLTAERFVPNPWRENEMIYRSGDTGRWLYDGTIEYLDRIDGQVQVRGFRVETAEIELQLKQFDGVTDSVVVAIDRDGTKELAAYLVSDGELKINRLKSFLSALLPEYMIPAYFIRTDKIPLTSNGKLDRKLLPPPVQNIATGSLFEHPSTEIEAKLLDLWQEVLPTQDISIHDNFFDIGGNSILLVKLFGKINGCYPDAMELTDLFTRSRIADQAEYIALKNEKRTVLQASSGNQNSASKFHDIAIIGISARIGHCENTDEFWKELCNGADFIRPLPSARVQDVRELSEYYNIPPTDLKFREYCYLPEVDKFDPGFFRLSPSEAALMDPGQRLFMETGYLALEDAGYGGSKLWGSRTGVFIGASDHLGEYAKFLEAADNQDPNLLFVAQTPSILASRLSYHLNLKGPALLVDTACSSSLVALHLACQSIRDGKIDSAIVGGTKVHLLPLDTGSRLEIDSSDGRTRSFDDKSDGTGGGEGVIAMFLKPLDSAIKDNDHIYAVIKGSCINQDGNSNGITAPNAEAQADVLEQAWLDAGIDPLTISYIETHGTATNLGDPIEIDGITKAFKKFTPAQGFCAIGAVKANIGHLDTAAGLAGLLKAVLSLKNRQLTPMAHFQSPNKHINFEVSAAFVNKNLTDWTNNTAPLRCGVSSFGLSGTNCHVVLEEAPQIREELTAESNQHLLVLSTRSKSTLVEYAREMHQYLGQNPEVAYSSLCYTLATGRGHYIYRLAIEFENRQELERKLRNFTDPDNQRMEGIHYACTRIVSSNKKDLLTDEIRENEVRQLSNEINLRIGQSGQDRELVKLLAEVYVKGAEISWEEYYCNIPQAKLSLPAHPFDRKRYWVKTRKAVETRKGQVGLYQKEFQNLFLEKCIMDLPVVSVYTTTYSTDNWLMNEHRVMGIPTLVGVSYLQIACEAGKNHYNSSLLTFDDFYLLKPLAISGELNVEAVTTLGKQESDRIQAVVQSKIQDNDWSTYAKFSIRKLSGNRPEKLNIEEIAARMPHVRMIDRNDQEVAGDQLVQVSRKWNCLRSVNWDENELLAELTVPEEDRELASTFDLYPPLLDAALSSAVDESGFLPYSFGTVELWGAVGNHIFSYIRKLPAESPETRSFHITLTNEEGEVVAQFRNFTLKRVARNLNRNIFHELTWKAWPLMEVQNSAGKSIVVLYSQGCNQNLFRDFLSTEGLELLEIVEDNYEELFARLTEIPGKIIFLVPSVSDVNGIIANNTEEKLSLTLCRAFAFAKYLTHHFSAKLDLLFVGTNVFEITQQESGLSPFSSAVAGLGQVLQQESPNIRCRFLDIDEDTSALSVISEANEGFSESFYARAFRNGLRYIREIRQVKLEVKSPREFGYREGGVYLIAGGTGGIGLEIAHFFARQAKIRLILINRSEFPPRNLWQNLLKEQADIKTCRKIEKILAIEREGSEVFCYTTDIADFEQLKSTLEMIRVNHGKICGVVNAAGVAGDGFLYNKEMRVFRDVLNPKIAGSLNIARLLMHEKPDFFLMTSALTAILPTSGQSDYTAANSFQDALSFELKNSGWNAFSVNLTSWQDTGMTFGKNIDDKIFKSISASDAVEAIGKILESNVNSIILGEPDLSYADRVIDLPFYLDKGATGSDQMKEKTKAPAEPEPGTADQIVLQGRENGIYTDFEKAVAKIWGEVLGYTEININENFYDLGGDSIYAININSQIEKSLNIQLTIGELFNHLTIAELAEFLEGKASEHKKENVEVPKPSLIPPAGKREFYPLSSAQRSLFILDRLAKDKLSYHIPEIWNIKGKLDHQALESAFGKLIERHEILRTSFELYDEVPAQRIDEKGGFSLTLLQMNEQEARSYIRGFIRPFDLAVAPLFRAELIALSAENHLLLFDAHHIIIDAFSMEVLKKDLFSFYEGREPEPLRIQYKDFSVWQNASHQSEEAVARKRFWLDKFVGEIPILDIPLDFPRNSGQSAEAGVFSLCLDEKLTSKIKKLSADQGISTFMVLLSVYNLVLHKYSRQDDIIIGVTSMGRDHEDLSGVLGMFVKNLPVRTFPREDIRIADFFGEVKETVIEAFANQDYPFDELIEELKIKRDLNRSPLYDVVFSYMNFALTEMKNGELQISDFRAETTSSAEYDLMLYGLEAEDRIYITIKYKKSLFRKENIERFARHFEKITMGVIGNPQARIGEISLLLPEDRTLLAKFNTHYEAIENPLDALSLLEESFLRNQGKVALIHGADLLSYKELEDKSNQFANYLSKDCGVRPGDLVGIMLDRTFSMVVAMLGTLKCGASYVGIDIAYPRQRKDFILKDCKTKIVITDQEWLQDNAPNPLSGTRIVSITDPAIARQETDFKFQIPSPDDTAYVIYTSGSTGEPKGVVISHKNLAVFLNWCRLEFASTNFDLVYASSSYCFDISVFEIYYSLIAGKSVRILKSAIEIPEYLGKDKKVLVNTVPSLFAAIREDISEEMFHSLTAINLAGEQIPQALIEGIDCDRMEVRNLYGPSEDTTYSTCYKFSNNQSKVFIGKPISNTQVYIVDDNLQIIPSGHTGEICLAGDGLAKGYLFRETLTNEKFIENPFGNGRLYRTGDLGRWNINGDLEYLGRTDRQVKIRGFRIELGEIENNIMHYPSVRQAVAIAQEKGSEKYIVAYFVAAVPIDFVDIKNYLSRIMPAYMIPTFFIQVGKLPPSPNGKIDLKALPEPEPFERTHVQDFSIQLNPTEERLAEIWKRVLVVTHLGKEDNFFDLGGHSLKAIRLLSQINREFNYNGLLSDIFEYPTIAEFARLLEKPEIVTVSRIVPLEKRDFYEVSHAQRRLWVMDRMEKRSTAYNIPVVYHIDGSLDIGALQGAFQAILHKFESLRTCFIEVGGEPKQKIADTIDFKIDVAEVFVNQDIVLETKELVRKLITVPFDLGKAPLIAVTLLKQASEDQYILVVNVHHIVLDEWSIAVFAQHLNLFYDHYSGKNPIKDVTVFNPSSIQYKEFADWHNHQLQENDMGANEHKKYWLELFRSWEQNLNLPTDYPRPREQSFDGKTVTFSLGPLLSKELRDIGNEHGTTLFITTLALVNILLSRLSHQKDVVIGTPVANREHQDFQDQIGFFLNTLALRNQMETSESFRSLLGRIKKSTLEAYAHQVYPFNLLVDELNLPRDLSRSPLFDVMLISQTPSEDGTKSTSGLQMEAVEFDYPSSKFDLSISYFDDGQSIRYFFEYNTALFKNERIESMFGHFKTLIEDIVANQDLTIGQLKMVPAGEQESILKLSAGKEMKWLDASIVSLIEKRVLENKENLSVLFKRTKLTYQEINAKSNQLAHFLLEMGIQPGDCICVMLDRSEWSVLAMLAVLKAGGVYVPVDPDYPQSRIDFIIRDCEGKILITTDKYAQFSSLDPGRVFTKESLEGRIGQLNSENPGVPISADEESAAYVIYTSGSTGEPKGVVGTHKCLLNLVEWQTSVIESGLRTLQFAPHNFDVSIQEILFALATGGTLYLIEKETRHKMSLIAELIEKEGIELLTMPYSALNLFLGELESMHQMKSLKHVITSGEQPFISPPVGKLLKSYPSLLFHNQYGPSETHVVTSFTLSGSHGNNPFKIPMGKPIDNTQVYLLDRQMQLVPIGVAGELYIGGYNVAKGYLRKPELTEKSFVDNPFGKGKLYRTGDQARWNFDGEMEFLGRDDGQAKIRGYRIELGEIESAILKYPQIAEAAVKVYGEGSDKAITAYFSTREDVDRMRMKEFLAKEIPSYMIPDYLIRVDTLPRTPSGKIDFRSLPQPGADDYEANETQNQDPEGETEVIIAEVWKEILHRERIGSRENFFEIGGNSIKAIQVMSKVQKRLGKKTYLNLIFREPTISGMAGVILNTDAQMKNMEADMLLLNQPQEKKVFFLPPGIGYSFAYMEYARYLDNCSVYGLNFTETDHPAETMAKLIQNEQKSGKVYLFGHSAGGNMAFDVAIELQNLGMEIGGLIFLDSYRQTEVISWSEEEYLEDAILYIEQNHAEFMDEEIKDAALRKIVAYRRYLNARSEDGKILFPLIQISAIDEITKFENKISRSAWAELTPVFTEFDGFGGHMDMLKRPNLEQNAKLTAQILDSFFGKSC